MQEIILKLAKKIKPAHLVLALMILFALFNGSLYNWIYNKIEVRKLTQRNAEADKEFAVLSASLEKLEKGDTAYLESVARTKYNLSKPGEIEIRLARSEPADKK
ncbi:MAG: septum formation initiator family protein [Elusimicrobia bacterium]|nr:septum formation initiator family protein [Elusimicrobiota bacterium]